MAGGVGSRFWPESTAEMPKQFLDILGTGKSLIQETYTRFKTMIPAENFRIVTHERYVDIILEQLPELIENQILTEPERRNTAPCISYALNEIEAESFNMIVTPADHIIKKQKAFEEILQIALEHCNTHDDLLTLGITPTRRDTGYGYIEYDDKSNSDIKPVIQFTEKPDRKTAEEFLFQGNFSWNSGMFIWNKRAINQAFNHFLPEVNNAFADALSSESERRKDAIRNAFFSSPEISLDYGILEKASNVRVINADIGWSDLGTWRSVAEYHGSNESNNLALAGEIVESKSTGNIIKVSEDKKVILHNIKDLIIVDSDNVLLILPKEDEQEIKSLRIKASEKFKNVKT